jgi:hypothetical protein
MTRKGEDRENGMTQDVALGREDEVFVDRMREVYQAPERSAARNAAFYARLEERLEERRRGVPWLGALVGAAAAAALALLVLTGTEDERDEPGSSDARQVVRNEVVPTTGERETEEGSASSASAVEDALVALTYGYEYGEDDGSDASGLEESLPNDYVAIESLFLGG